MLVATILREHAAWKLFLLKIKLEQIKKIEKKQRRQISRWEKGPVQSF